MYIAGPSDDTEKIIRRLGRNLGEGNHDFTHLITD
jgi:hypothetical protein